MNYFIGDLIYRYPRYSSACISSVESAVQIQVDSMKSIARKCENCLKCTGKGFQAPKFVNNTCLVQMDVGGILTVIFHNASTILTSMENAWQRFRDDAIQKITYLIAKSFNSYKTFDSMNKFLKDFADFIPFDIRKFGETENSLWNFYTSIKNQMNDFNSVLIQLNDYFMFNTDQFIIKSNQILNQTLIRNWNNTKCRDGILRDFFQCSEAFLNDWTLFMSSLFFIDSVDAEISAVFTEVTNFTIFAELCVSGINATSNLFVKMNGSECLNRVGSRFN